MRWGLPFGAICHNSTAFIAFAKTLSDPARFVKADIRTFVAKVGKVRGADLEALRNEIERRGLSGRVVYWP